MTSKTFTVPHNSSSPPLVISEGAMSMVDVTKNRALDKRNILIVPGVDRRFELGTWFELDTRKKRGSTGGKWILKQLFLVIAKK